MDALNTMKYPLSSSDGIACTKCDEWLRAPEWKYDFQEEGIVINLWSCVNCGNQFETETSTNGELSSKLYSSTPPLASRIHDDDKMSAALPLVA